MMGCGRRLAVVWMVLAVGLSGCESLQRKFTRKPKHPEPVPSPIIQFQDYTRTMTPLDRYRKHYLMFDYWNSELLDALQQPPLNSKRFRRDSSETLGELQTLQQLLNDGLASRLAPLIKERMRFDQDLRSGSFSDAQASALLRTLEAQTRQIHREFFWRDVQDQLAPNAITTPASSVTSP